MGISASFMRKLEKVSPELRDILLSLTEELDRSVTREEFTRLTSVVAELAEAQRKTEQRVNELAEAQAKTEQEIRS